MTALPTAKAIYIIEDREPDKAAHLLGDIRSEHVEPILADLENPEEVRPLMIHPDESTGGLMTLDFLALRYKGPQPKLLKPSVYRNPKPRQYIICLWSMNKADCVAWLT